MASVFAPFLKVKRHPKLMDKVICPGNYLVIVLYNSYSETRANAREFEFLVQDCLVLHSNDQVAQSSEQAPVTSGIVGSIPTSDS